MEYQVVSVEEKVIVGLGARTSNSDPEMGAKIGGLWQKLFSGNIAGMLQGTEEGCTYGVYTNYESDVNGAYDVIAGFPVKSVETLPEGLTKTVLPAGKYARFSLTVNMQSSEIGDAWDEIWNTPLNRAYTADFEEYLPSEDMRQAPVNIYIALAE